MNRLFLTIIIAFFTFLAFQQNSFAVCSQGLPDTFTCDTAPPNPDLSGVQQENNDNGVIVNVLPGAGIDTSGTPGLPCIFAGEGADNVTVENGDLKCGLENGGNEGIRTRDGNDIIDVKDSKIEARDGIRSGFGDDTVNVVRTMINSSDDCVDLSSGDDIVNVTDVMCEYGFEGIVLANGNDTASIVRSQFLCGNEATCMMAIEASDDNDKITVLESILEGEVDLSSGNDTMELATGSEIDGLIDCGPDFDTLVFALEVPEERINFFSNQIALATVPDGSVTINGFFYEWTDCELLVNELVGVRELRPIPTLSEWGLVALAAAMGVFGIFYAVRRRAAADA